MKPGQKGSSDLPDRHIAPDENPIKGDTIPDGRQNIYPPGPDRPAKLYSARQASQMTGYSPVTVRVLHRQLDMQEKVDGRPLFSVEDIRKLHDRKSRHRGASEVAKTTHQHRQPMDSRAVSWELFESNRAKIEALEQANRGLRDQLWEFRKSIATLSGDIEELKRKRGGERGRGVSILGRTAPLTLNDHEAEAA